MRVIALRILPALVVAAAFPLAAATPGVAAGWLTGAPISAPADVAVTPSVAVSPTGERFAAWERLDPTTSNSLGLAVRSAAVAGDFGPVQLIADPDAESPTLATGSNGTAALVWVSDTSLHIATRAAGGGNFVEASPFPLSGFGEAVSVAMRGGDVFAAVQAESSTGNVETTTIQAVHLTAGGSAITQLAGAGPGGVIAQASFNESTEPEHTVAAPTIALNGTDIHVAWEDLQDAPLGNGMGVTKVQRASGTGGPFSAPATVDTIPDPSFFRAADVGPVIAAGGGHVDVAYTTPAGRVAYQDVAAAGPIQTVTPDGGGFNLHAGVDPAGTLVLAWQRFGAPDLAEGVFASVVPTGASQQPVARLTPLNASRRLATLAMGPDGSALAVIDRAVSFSGSNAESDVQASFRPPGGPFGALEEISGPQDRTNRDASFDAAAATIGSGGRTLVAWGANDRSGTLNERLFISERDGTPPVLGAVSVQATGDVDAPVAMTASAADTQSAASVSWDFGDGSQGTGGSVSHAYGVAGVYPVTVTATDPSGNSVSATRVLAIVTPGASDNRAPIISQLRSAHPRFRASTAATAQIARHKAKPPAGTVFTLNVDERSTLVYSISGRAAGRRAGHACIAGRKTGSRCRASVTPAPLIRTASGPGRVALSFSGRIGAARLAPGSYLMSVTAIDAAGNRSRPATVAFTVVSR
jgi:PKD domain